MPRKARTKSKTGVYHIMLRGINRQQIFEDDEDQKRFLETLYKYKEQSGYSIYAYCLMGNHIHLVIKEGKEDLALMLKRIAGSYVYWYNWKYRRCGHLFQDRFKSEPIDDEAYLLTVIRYVHENPVAAGLCKRITDYKHSSIVEYLEQKEIVDTKFVFSIMPKEEFINFHEQEVSERCLDIEENYRLTDREAIEIIYKVTKCKSLTEIQNLDRIKRNSLIRKLYLKGLSIRQISRLTGISKKIVETNI